MRLKLLERKPNSVEEFSDENVLGILIFRPIDVHLGHLLQNQVNKSGPFVKDREERVPIEVNGVQLRA